MINLWECKMGGTAPIPAQFDSLARAVIEALYLRMVGQPADFTISGWDGQLTASEMAVMHDRYPDVPEYQ